MNNNELICPLLRTTVAEELHPSYGLGRPLGIANVYIRDIIDTDEMGLFLESLNRCFGKTPQGERCNDRGAFKNYVPKLNVLAGICGDLQGPRRANVMD